MLKNRLIAVIIIRDGQVVQSVRFRHTNVIHSDAFHAVEAFSKWSVDEIIILNVTKDPSSREEFANIISRISSACFVPLTAGGWVTDIDYARDLLRCGADKLVVNTILLDNESMVRSLSERFGRQCIVASMDVKANEEGEKCVVVDRGRRFVDNCTPTEWAMKASGNGAGEIFFNSIDHDGARKGYDTETLGSICKTVDIPVIAFGGVFTWNHFLQGFEAGADAVAAANIFHYTEQSTKKAKMFLAEAGIPVRKEGRFLK